MQKLQETETSFVTSTLNGYTFNKDNGNRVMKMKNNIPENNEKNQMIGDQLELCYPFLHSATLKYWKL